MRKLGSKYLAYTKPFDEALARERFEERFGHKPKEVIYEGDKYMLIGPVEDVINQK